MDHREIVERKLGEDLYHRLAAQAARLPRSVVGRRRADWREVAILWHTSDAFAAFYRALRAGTADDLDHAMLAALEVAFADRPVSEVPIIRRRIRLQPCDLERLHETHAVGKVIVLELPASCTARGVVRIGGEVSFVIHHRSGREIDRLSLHPAEREVVLLSGTRLLVTSFIRTEELIWEIEQEELI